MVTKHNGRCEAIRLAMAELFQSQSAFGSGKRDGSWKRPDKASRGHGFVLESGEHFHRAGKPEKVSKKKKKKEQKEIKFFAPAQLSDVVALMKSRWWKS